MLFYTLQSAQMADLVLAYDNYYYGQQCAEAIGARLNYPAFMNIISTARSECRIEIEPVIESLEYCLIYKSLDIPVKMSQ